MRRTLRMLAGRPPPTPGGPVLLAGSGTSRHAAELAAGWLSSGGVEAQAKPATEEPDLAGVRTVVGISQSGTTGSILRLLDRAAGRQRIVVTNEPESPAVRRADRAYVTRAGRETAIPATKSFTSALVALAVLARDLGADGPDCAGAADLVVAGVAEEGRLREFLDPLPPRTQWFFLARSPLLPLAREAALKMMETALLPALALPAGELAHGPAALLSGSTPVVGIGCPAPTGPESPAQWHSVAPCSAGRAPTLSLEGELFRLAPVIQLLAWMEGQARGLDVDAPPGLVKSVVDD